MEPCLQACCRLSRASARAISHARPSNRTHPSLAALAPFQSPCSRSHAVLTSLRDPGDRCSLIVTGPNPCSHIRCQSIPRNPEFFPGFCEAIPDSLPFCSAPSCPAEVDAAPIASEDARGRPVRIMCCFFLLHGVVLSLASKDVRSPFLPLRRATILRIVPSFGSRMIHVRRPAFCVPIVTFRLERPAHVWAAVISVTPHCVRPYSPLTGHHLKPCAVSLCTSFPMWKASMTPMAMSSSSTSFVRF